MHQPHITSGSRYPVLRTLAILWLVSAVLVLAGGIYQAVCALVDARGQEMVLLHSAALGSRVMASFTWLAATFFAVILNVAIAELIKLAIDVERNTRGWINAAPAARTESAMRDANGRDAIENESAEAALIHGR